MARRRKDEDDAQLGRGFYQSTMEELPEEPRPLSPEGVLFPEADGSILVSVDGAEPEPEKNETAILSQFDSNLAELLDETSQIKIGQEIKQMVEADLRSREKWEARMMDGLEIIGFADIPEDAVAFVGAARVTYPGIAEAMVQFQARAMEELMPAEGPVKVGVIGKSDAKLEERAERVQDYMNYQLTEEDDEYYNETDTLLLMLPYDGSVFRKIAPDPIFSRTRSRLVPAKDFIVPYFATSLKTAPRYTHRYSMPGNVYKRAVAAGYFIDADFQAGMTQGEGSDRTREDTTDDRTQSYHEEDQDLQFYETTIDWEFEDFSDPFAEGKTYKLPYVITWEWETGRVVRVARCWDEGDETCQKDVWFTHYKFLPGFGFYGWGYLHIIGGLGRAASGALRLLLDGSATASLQGGFKSRDARVAGEINFEPAVWQDVDMSAEELAKSFYSPPFKEPSPALFKTLEILINGLQRFASTTEAMVGEASNTGPVGTTVALIEQGSKIFSGIHKRIHAAARIEFKLIARCNFRFMGEQPYPFAVAGSEPREVLFEDFDPKTVDVIPVSDPNIFSSVQRIALWQAGLQLVEGARDLYPPKARRAAHRGMLKALRIPGAEDWLPDDLTKRMDPVSENVALLNGHGIQVYAEQDHEAHLTVHAAFEQELAGMDPEIQQQAMPALKAHKAAHFAEAYRLRLQQQMMSATGGIPLPPYDPNNPETYEELPPEVENAVAIAASGYAPPPPPPSTEEAQDQADADFAAQRDADRKDMQAARDEDRKDAQKAAELQREGLVPDVDSPPIA